MDRSKEQLYSITSSARASNPWVNCSSTLRRLSVRRRFQSRCHRAGCQSRTAI